MKKLLVTTLVFLALNSSLPAQSPEQLEIPIASSELSKQDAALIQSAFDGKLADVEVFVSKGANVNVEAEKKRTPLILAAYNGHTSVVEFLHSKGADINFRDKDGQSALIYAAKRSNNETAAFLIANGAEVNYQSTKVGITALMLAAGWGNVELVEMLLEQGADPSLTDRFGRTARGVALERGNSAVLEVLPEPPTLGALSQ